MAARHLTALLALAALSSSPAAQAAPGARPLVEAMPPTTVEALFLEPLQRLEPAMDGLSAALGGGFALSFAEVAALPNLVLRAQARGDPGALGLDPSGGLGIFRVDGYAGAVGVVAVSDEVRAMDALVHKLRADGAEHLGSSRAGIEFQLPGQPPVMAFTHGGFLYLAMPDDPPGRQANRELSALVRGAPATGLGGTPLWLRLSSRVDRRGAVVFFRRRPLEQAADVLGLLMAIRPQAHQLSVNGFAATARPLDAGAPPGDRDLLRNAPGSPAVVLSSHLGPQVVRALLLGDLALPAGALLPPWLDLGDEAEALVAAMGGGLDALAYTRASVAVDDALAGDPEEAVLWEVSLQDERAANAALRGRSRRRLSGGEGAPWRFRIRDGALGASLGPAPSGPPRDVLADLSARFGGGAFGPGHFSLYVDLPMIRESFLDEAAALPALLPRGNHVFLDAGAVPGGLAIRGELSLVSEDEPVGRR